MCFDRNCKSNKFKEYDYFGTPIGVTFNGESTYKTRLGACATLLVIFFIGSNALVTVLQALIAPEFTSKTLTFTN